MLFPSEDFAAEIDPLSTGTKFVVEHDMLRALVSMIDLVGLYYVINAKKLFTVMGDIDIRLISIGLGWAAAELVSTHFLDVIFQGWSNELKMEYIFNALQANIDILEIISLTFLTYTLTKKEDTAMKNLVYLLALGRYLLPVAIRYIKEYVLYIEHKSASENTSDCGMETILLGVKIVFAGLLFVTSQ